MEAKEPYLLCLGLDRLEFRYSWPFPASEGAIAKCAKVCQTLGEEDGQDVLFCTGRPPQERVGVLFRLFGEKSLLLSVSGKPLASWGPGWFVEWGAMFADILSKGEQLSSVVSGADLFCDLQGLPALTQEFADRSFGRGPRRKRFSYRPDGSFESATFGSSKMFYVSVYDKTPALEAPNYEWLVALWMDRASKTFDPTGPVTRVEFRFRKSEALTRMGFPREPAAFVSALSETWARLCRRSLWFREPGSSRQKDWARAEWWRRVVASARFEDVGSAFVAGIQEPETDPALLLAMARGVLASLVSSQTGENRELVKARLSLPLSTFVREEIRKAPGR